MKEADLEVMVSMAFFVFNLDQVHQNSKGGKKMFMTAESNQLKKMSSFEEDVYSELQKWERCASP